MSPVRLSVALPVYNGANYLGSALDSLLAQEFGDFEIVAADNCSSDETADLLADYSRRDRRIRVERSDTFLAQADNVNRAVALAEGDWVKLFCHDDLMQPNCMGAVRDAIETVCDDSVGLIGNGETWLFANGVRYAAQGSLEEVRRYNGRELVGRILRGGGALALPSLTTATVRKAAWARSSGFDSRFLHFDVFLWQRLLMEWNYVSLPSTLTVNRVHDAQVAVSARRGTRSIEDHRVFYAEFLHEYASELGLTAATRLKARLKPASVAASTISLQLVKRRFGHAFRLMARVPFWWWPLLPVLAARNLKNEWPRIEALRKSVPLALIYPG